VDWGLEQEQDKRILRVGFDFDLDSIVMHESVDPGNPWRAVALTSIWVDTDVNSEGIRVPALPNEDSANLIRINWEKDIVEGAGGGQSIEHLIPDGTPGWVIAGCTDLNSLSYIIDAYLNGVVAPEWTGCRLFNRIEPHENFVALLTNPVTLTVHVGDYNITAYEIQFMGQILYVLIEREQK
jgi:hypothetical protein